MFFDSTSVEDSFEVAPEGEYGLTIVKAEVAPTKNGNGVLCAVTFKIDGTDSTVMDRFNIKHQNEKAAQIGRGQLKRLCELVDKPVLQRPDDLIGSKVFGTIIHKEFDGNVYANIKKYRRFEGVSVGGVEMSASFSPEANDGLPF